MSNRMEENIQEAFSGNDKQTGRKPEEEDPMGPGPGTDIR